MWLLVLLEEAMKGEELMELEAPPTKSLLSCSVEVSTRALANPISLAKIPEIS